LVALRVHQILIEDEECNWIYERPYIWTAEKDMNWYDMIDHRVSIWFRAEFFQAYI